MSVLILTEKPKQAKAIGKLVEKYKREQRGFSGDFAGKHIVVFPLSGSILEVDDDIFDDYNRNDLTPLPFVPDENGHIPRKIINTSRIPQKQQKIKEEIKNWDSKISICSAFANMMKKFDYEHIVLATDPDYEGASLGVEFLEYHGLYGNIPIHAANIANLSAGPLKREIIKAMHKEDAYNWELFRFIGSARADENACIGINGTRLLRTLTDTYITFGTQQTRLLQKIVERTKEHDNFNKIKKYRLKVHTDFGEFVLQLPEEEKEKITNKTYMSNIASIIESNNILIVETFETQKIKKRSPAWVDGSKMANMVSNKMTPNTTVSELMRDRNGLLQVMYEKEIMTYPRGECLGMMPLSQLEEQKEIAKMLSKYYDAPRLNTSLVKKYLWYEEGEPLIRDNKEVVVNHTPYTISSADIEPEVLTKDERIVFDEAAKIVLSAFYPDNKQIRTIIHAKVSDYHFKYIFTHDYDLGWKALYNVAPVESKLKKQYTKGDFIVINQIELEEYTDNPKPLYTENSLHLMMKKYRIGAESTFATHIKNILDKGKFKRGFTKVENGKIRATERGIAIIELLPQKTIDGIKEFDEKIIDPLLRKEMLQDTARAVRNKIIIAVYKQMKEVLEEAIENPDSEKGQLIKKIKEGEGVERNLKRPQKAKFCCPECGSEVVQTSTGNYSCVNRKIKKIDEAIINTGTCEFFMYGKFKNANVSGVIPEESILDIYNGKKVVVEGVYEPKDKNKRKIRIEISISNKGKNYLDLKYLW
ncbi:MAG TPA: type IA DNA topoisomerase [Epsilonproteobacteria bacterium]|nr:type IA DNA topoisomerase [Campylobacterota bacterium]